jgi:hypothetical protein
MNATHTPEDAPRLTYFTLSKLKPKHGDMDVSDDCTRSFRPKTPQDTKIPYYVVSEGKDGNVEYTLMNSEYVRESGDERAIVDAIIEDNNLYYVHFKCKGLKYIQMGNPLEWIYDSYHAKVYFGRNLQFDHGSIIGEEQVLNFGAQTNPFAELEVEMIIDLRGGLPTVFVIIDKKVYGSVWGINGPTMLSIHGSTYVQLIDGPIPETTWDAYMNSYNEYGVQSMKIRNIQRGQLE